MVAPSGEKQLPCDRGLRGRQTEANGSSSPSSTSTALPVGVPKTLRSVDQPQLEADSPGQCSTYAAGEVARITDLDQSVPAVY
jgi:hypothetical protein